VRVRLWLPLILALVASPVAAAEPPCPLDIATCVARYQLMRERPWLGVAVDRDSLGAFHIVSVTPGAPAEAAGMKSGDVLQSISEKPPADWFAGRASWKAGDHSPIVVLRDGHERTLQMRDQVIPEDVLAKIIGTHIIEGHLAYMHHDPTSEQIENH
jgi:predicted metalloprotease with PDZ domain